MPNSASQVWEDLADTGEQLLNQIKASAQLSYKGIVTQLKTPLTVEEANDLEWGVNTLTASSVLSLSADEPTLLKLGQQRLAALSVIADIEAIKAHQTHNLVTTVISKSLSLITTFLLQGEQVVIAALVKAAV